MNYLESRKGVVRTEEEWKAECKEFYSSIAELKTVSNQWERFKRVIGLHPVGVESWDFRKPAQAQREGRTFGGYEHD